MWLAEELVCIRDRNGEIKPLFANRAQWEFEQKRARQNIVLKARQLGMTTWIAARFFLKTVIVPGTMTVQVAHTQQAAEAIFRMVHRMLEWMPDGFGGGVLEGARSSAGRIFFPRLDSEYRVWSAGDENAGRGLTIHHLHCSEVSRWPGDAGQVLAGLRAALVPDGELVLESTANGAYGAFDEEWCRAEDVAREGAMQRHFFPWWMEASYVGPCVECTDMRDDEWTLAMRHGLSEAQIGFRRGLERSYGGLRLQEFAEDAESCFRATGVCCFEVEAIEQRMAELDDPLERRRGGALCVWLRPIQGREYCVAVDTAGGGEEGDFAAVQVVDVKTGVQCAELQEKVRPSELARVTAELAREYGGALVVVERNNHGSAVLAYLETSERYARVYKERGEAGWLTTMASKPEMIARLGVLLPDVCGGRAWEDGRGEWSA